MKTPVNLLIEKISEIEFYSEPYKSLVNNLLDYADQLRDLERKIIEDSYNSGINSEYRTSCNYYNSNFGYDIKSTQRSRVSRKTSGEDRADV